MLKILGCLWFVIPMMILIDRIKGTLALGGVSNIRVFLQHGPLGSKDSSSGKIQMTPENQAIVLVSLQSRKRNGSIFIFRQCASTPPYMTFSVLSFGLQKSWVRDQDLKSQPRIQAMYTCTLYNTVYSSTVYFVLCTVVQLFSSKQEMDYHMFHMSTFWSEDLVSFSFYLTFVLVTFYMQTKLR